MSTAPLSPVRRVVIGHDETHGRTRTAETARMAFVLVGGTFGDELRQPTGGDV